MTNETLVIPTLVVINVYRCLQKLWITRSASLFTLLFLNRRFWFERSYLSHALITGLHGFWQCHDVTETICLPWIIGSIDRWTLGDVRTRLTNCSFNARRRIVFVFLLTTLKLSFLSCPDKPQDVSSHLEFLIGSVSVIQFLSMIRIISA